MTTHHKIGTISLVLGAALIHSNCALAQDANGYGHHHCIDWTKLHLNNSQNERIRVLQSEWSGQYGTVMPEIHFQQHHLQELFRNPQSDPLEIVSTQQSIMRLQEQLRNDAMTNYLHKRAVLSDPQQRELEAQLHEMVLERQQRSRIGCAPAEPGDESGLGNIMQKIRWAIGAH
jgi:Spy/CpxP family protein refolding chaperone